MKILSIIEFGSAARKDQDQFSDRDICIVVDAYDKKEDVINLSRAYIDTEISTQEIDFIIHDKEAFEYMLKNGSLFLWHLKLECQPIFGREFYNEKMKTLTLFDNYSYKYEHYIGLLDDLLLSQSKLPKITSFDYSVLFTVVRNMSILLAFKCGKPKFGRLDAFLSMKYAYPDLELTERDYKSIMMYKLTYERGAIRVNNYVEFDVLLQKVTRFCHRVKNILEIE
jgi:predicted nucleotidyltransferase